MFEEIENEEELALQKIQEELQNENIDKMVGCATCDICQHEGSFEANTVYFDNNKNIDVVQIWFKNKYSKNFSTKALTNHFKDHIEPFISSVTISRQNKLEKLKKQSTSIKDTAHKIPMIMEMLWQRMADIHCYEKPTEADTDAEKEDHRKSSKEMVELSKAYREFYQMNFDMMGLGKSPEEQIQAVQDCFNDMVDKFSDRFKDNPEIQKQFEDFMKGLK